MDDLIQESCEKVILSWRKIMWTKPSTTRDSVHTGHTVVKIKGSPSGGCKLYILLCIGLDKNLTDWLVPMKAAYISEVSAHRKSTLISRPHSTLQPAHLNPSWGNFALNLRWHYRCRHRAFFSALCVRGEHWKSSLLSLWIWG